MKFQKLGWFIIGILIIGAASACAEEPTSKADFIVVQMNDVYRLDAVENDRSGGMGRVLSLVRKTQSDYGAPVYIFHAGDFLFPSLESQYFQGEQMVEGMNFLNAASPLIVVPGNHEFDSKNPEVFRRAINQSQFSWLASNIRWALQPPLSKQKILPDTLIRIGNISIGVFGLTLHGAHEGKDRDYASMDVRYRCIAEEKIQKLKRKGAGIIIALTHLSMAQDRLIADLHKTYPEFLWVAGGHEHTAMYSPLTDSTALITKGDSNARRVWRVFFSAARKPAQVYAERLSLNSTIPLASDYQRQIVEKFRDRLLRKIPFLYQKIGETTVPIDASEETVRSAESNWGNFLTDVMRGAFADVEADMAIINGGALRLDDRIPGEIRFEHLFRTLVFPTRIGMVWLRGADIRNAVLEHAVGTHPGDGRFLQVSGVKFKFDWTLPVGARVSDVFVRTPNGWEPLHPEKLYAVAVTEYLLKGGDGYRFGELAQMSLPPAGDLKWMAVAAITDSLARGKAIAPKLEKRIVEISR